MLAVNVSLKSIKHGEIFSAYIDSIGNSRAAESWHNRNARNRGAFYTPFETLFYNVHSKYISPFLNLDYGTASNIFRLLLVV